MDLSSILSIVTDLQPVFYHRSRDLNFIMRNMDDDALPVEKHGMIKLTYHFCVTSCMMITTG